MNTAARKIESTRAAVAEGGPASRDDEAGKGRRSNRAARWLDGAIMFWLFAFAVSAPHSIAATQTAWGVGLLLWLARLTVRPRWRRTPLDFALLAFFLLTCVSAFFSYEPAVSIGKLRGAGLFTIVYLVAQNVRSRVVLRRLAFVLVASCAVSVIYTAGERVAGRGVRVEGVAPNGPLAAAAFRNAAGLLDSTPIRDGDTILEVVWRKVRGLEEIAAVLDAPGVG